MLSERRHHSLRWLLAGFTLALAALLAIWSYASSAQVLASLTATPNQPRQNETVTLIGTGFAPNEVVSIWVTLPDFSVFGIAEVESNGDGNFNYPYLADFLSATNSPTGKWTYTARGKNSGREVYATIQVNIGAAPGTSREVKMKASAVRGPQGTVFTFRGENFGTEEDVAIWVRYPDNTVLDLGVVRAGPSGAFEYTAQATSAPAGRYAFTGRGLRTGLNGIFEFDVTVGDMTRPSGKANLRVRPSNDDQRSVAVFEGFSFQPEEVVSIWVTLPDFSTAAIGDVVVSQDGAFVATFYLDEQLPAGRHTFTAYGNFSKLRATGEFELKPGGTPGQVQAPAPPPGNELEIIFPDQPKKGFDDGAATDPAVPPPPPYPAPVVPAPPPTTF